jgi:hypothetical protein
MPSVTNVQQQQQQSSSSTHGKSTPPPPTQQLTSVDPNNADAITQAIQVLEKKQRNLGKRKVMFIHFFPKTKKVYFSSGKIGKLRTRSKEWERIE